MIDVWQGCGCFSQCDWKPEDRNQLSAAGSSSKELALFCSSRGQVHPSTVLSLVWVSHCFFKAQFSFLFIYFFRLVKNCIIYINYVKIASQLLRMIRKNSIWQILWGIITETSAMMRVDFALSLQTSSAKNQVWFPQRAASFVWILHDSRHMSRVLMLWKTILMLMVCSSK